MNPEIQAVIDELEKARLEWACIKASEALGGNIVKEAEARGTIIGLQIAINLINDKLTHPV